MTRRCPAAAVMMGGGVLPRGRSSVATAQTVQEATMSANAESSPAEEAATAETDTGPVDQKARFKAALERKNAAAHARNQSSADGDNHISGDSHAAGAKRVFRRKSG